jgi:hypothetical protein
MALGQFGAKNMKINRINFVQKYSLRPLKIKVSSLQYLEEDSLIHRFKSDPIWSPTTPLLTLPPPPSLSGRAYESSIVTDDFLFSRRLFNRKVPAAFCLTTNTLLLRRIFINVCVFYRIVIVPHGFPIFRVANM